MNRVISACCDTMVVSSNHRGPTCGPKSLVASMSVRGNVMQRPDGSGMGADRASYASDQTFGPAARNRFASRAGRNPLYRADGLSVANAAERLSAVHDGARLFLRLAGQRLV